MEGPSVRFRGAGHRTPTTACILGKARDNKWSSTDSVRYIACLAGHPVAFYPLMFAPVGCIRLSRFTVKGNMISLCLDLISKVPERLILSFLVFLVVCYQSRQDGISLIHLSRQH